MVGLTFEVSIGLSAFSSLMWSTLPWAFPPLIDKEKKDEDKKRLYGYLRQAIQLFFLSAMFFVGQILAEATNFFSLIILVPIPSNLLLYGGLVAFVSALVFTYLVVDWVSSPEEERITNVYALGNELFVLIGFTIFEVFDGYFIYSFNEYLKNHSYWSLPLAYQIDYILFPVSALIYFFMVGVMRNKSRERRVLTTLAFFLPWVVLILAHEFGGL